MFVANVAFEKKLTGYHGPHHTSHRARVDFRLVGEKGWKATRNCAHVLYILTMPNEQLSWDGVFGADYRLPQTAGVCLSERQTNRRGRKIGNIRRLKCKQIEWFFLKQYLSVWTEHKQLEFQGTINWMVRCPMWPKNNVSLGNGETEMKQGNE